MADLTTCPGRSRVVVRVLNCLFGAALLWLCSPAPGGAASLAENAAPAPAGWPPVGVQAVFRVSAMGATVGETRWTIKRHGPARLAYESITEPTGLYSLVRGDVVRELSEFDQRGRHLVARHYRYSRTGGRRDRQVSVDFDWQRGEVQNTAKGQTWTMPVPTGAMDKLGYLLLVMRDLAAGQRTFSYPIAGGGKLETYRLHVGDETVIDTAIGSLQVVQVLRDDQTQRRTVLWCARRYGFLPVRIDHTERDGAEIRITIRSLDGL